MPDDRFAWLDRIKAVDREHSAARLAIVRLLDQAGIDSTILSVPARSRSGPPSLGKAIQLRDLKLASDRLEGTYVIRLFAEFESGLRHYWLTARKTDPPGRTRDLLDSMAARCGISTVRLREAHSVREYRNGLVHLRSEPAAEIAIGIARNRLCAFFSFLPENW
jgi:hypothetical protein